MLVDQKKNISHPLYIGKISVVQELGQASLITFGVPDRTFTEVERPNAFPYRRRD